MLRRECQHDERFSMSSMEESPEAFPSDGDALGLWPEFFGFIEGESLGAGLVLRRPEQQSGDGVVR